jgi:hypothetical protein
MGNCPDSGRPQHLLMAANTRKSVRLLAEVLGIRVLTNEWSSLEIDSLCWRQQFMRMANEGTLARTEYAVSER